MITAEYVQTFAGRYNNMKNLGGKLNNVTVHLVNGDRIVVEAEDGGILNTAPQAREGGVMVITGKYITTTDKDDLNEYTRHTAEEHHIALSEIQRLTLNYTKEVIKPRDLESEGKPQPEAVEQ